MVCSASFFRVLAVLSALAVCTFSRPMGGLFHDVIFSANSSASSKNGTCHEMGFYAGSTIQVSGKIKVSNKLPKGGVNVTIGVKLYSLRCANFLYMSEMKKENCGTSSSLERISNEVTLVVSGSINKLLQSTDTDNFILHPTDMIEVIPPTAAPTTAPANNGNSQNTGGDNSQNTDGDNSSTKTNDGPPAQVGDSTTNGDEANKVTTTDEKPTAKGTESTKVTPTKKAADRRRRNAKSESGTNVKVNSDTGNTPEAASKTDGGSVQENAPIIVIGNNTAGHKAGMYLLQVYLTRNGSSDNAQLEAQVEVKMRNPHGYLSAVDYPGLVFYGLMTSVYAIYGIAWIIMMLCSFSDLVRLQFWVMAVIILGFLEKTFFVAEYSAINLGNDTYGSYIVAEFVSAIKRGLSRMLLIIVAMGFGTVKPRLGDSLFKVVAAGVAYFSLALVDGIMRSRANTFHTNDTSSVVTLILLLMLDTFIFYWIFTAIVDTRRTLRLRKNYVKLAMYNHFAYTLIFAVIATLAFVIWVFVALEYPSGLCLTDWREAWLRDCFWHVLFAFILLVVMIIWRPSSNRSRFAYSLVADEEEVVFEQGTNKNFETVKMRSVNKGDAPPVVTSQAEDDLRWVEENLPTTAMDKALPLILDSDEEVMTTKFEMSKMN